jgi:hypothetical protein
MFAGVHRPNPKVVSAEAYVRIFHFIFLRYVASFRKVAFQVLRERSTISRLDRMLRRE